MTKQHARAFIAGQYIAEPEPADTLPLMNPTDGQTIGILECNSADTVSKAVADAKATFSNAEWSGKSLHERSKVLRDIASSVRSHAADLAACDTLCAGLPFQRSTLRHTHGAAAWFDYFADFLATQKDDAYLGTPGRTTLVTRKPRGVAGLFAPWNVPLGIVALKLSAALAAGNSCVVKPSEQTPLSMLMLAELMIEAGLPPGCVNVVNGSGPITGAALAGHPDVAAISFTGGGAAGAAIAQAAAARFVPVTMELGGKSPTLIFADCDYDRALDGALMSAYSNSGQACLAGTRILVEQSLQKRFIADFVDRAKAIRIAPPMDAQCEMGPMSSQKHRDSIEGHIERAKNAGARCLTGGGRPAGFEAGAFIEPTVLDVDDPANPVFQTEIFGPVAAVMSFKTDEEALALAEDTAYGLAAYVWTSDLSRALMFPKAMNAGTVLVNSAFQRELNAPFGGFKASGLGREGGQFSYDFYTQEQTIVMSDSPLQTARLGAQE